MNLQDLLNDQEFVEFCATSGILEKVKELVTINTPDSKDKLYTLIVTTEANIEFTDKLAQNHKTVIIGNGDVQNLDHGIELANQFGVDGIMIGRGIFKDPWAFLPRDQALELDTKSSRLNLLMEHLIQWQLTWGEAKHFAAMKKFVKMYISGFEEAGQLRSKFMELNDAGSMIALCRDELKKL
jgi:tRNA-dihydrouridine synthase